MGVKKRKNTAAKNPQVEILPAVSSVRHADQVEIEDAEVSSEDFAKQLVDEEQLVTDSTVAAPEILPKPLRPLRASSEGLVRYDPLEAYLREISSYPALNREEERELALKYFQNKDIEAAYRLVTHNLWLVVKLAREYENAARNLLDLIQEGNIGLMEAVKNFDPFREVRFPSYAVWWIKAYIIRYVIANLRLVKLGTTQAQRKLFFNLNKEKERLARAGFSAEPKLLAEKLNVRESEVVEMEQRLGSPDVSVDAPLQSDADSNLLGVIPDGALNAEELVGQHQMQQMLRDSLDEFAATLGEKERVIFEQRLLQEDRATLQDIAEKFDLSKERIRQLENRIKLKLKEFLLDRLGDDARHFEGI